MHYQNQRVTTLTAPLKALLESSAFTRTVSTGVDYYEHIDRPDLEFATDGVDVFGEYDSIHWLRSQLD